MTTTEIINDALNKVENMVNTYSFDYPEFFRQASMMHRTNQQSFTKLCLKWIEYVASDEYRTDGRNIASHNICRELLDTFKAKVEGDGFTGSSLEIMAKPSGYCNMV